MWGLNGFNLKYILLKRHVPESAINGVRTVIGNKVWGKSPFKKNKLSVIAARKVLPISPIKIFDGYQFNETKANKENTRKSKFFS